MKRSRFQDYLIEVLLDPRDGYQAVISRRDGKHIDHNGSARLVVAVKSFPTADAALAEACQLIKDGGVT